MSAITAADLFMSDKDEPKKKVEPTDETPVTPPPDITRPETVPAYSFTRDNDILNPNEFLRRVKENGDGVTTLEALDIVDRTSVDPKLKQDFKNLLARAHNFGATTPISAELPNSAEFPTPVRAGAGTRPLGEAPLPVAPRNDAAGFPPDGVDIPGVDPYQWRQFGPQWRPQIPIQGNEDAITKARADAMWAADPTPTWTGLNSPTMGIAYEVLGNNLGGGLNTNRERLDPKHDICDFLARRYAVAKDRGNEVDAHLALNQLEIEGSSGKNGFAPEAFRRLNYVDAVVDLRNATTDEQRMRALERIARLEARFGGKEFELDKLPERLTGKQPEDLSKMMLEARLRVSQEALADGVKSGDLSQQQDALRRIAKQEGSNPAAKDALEKFSKDNPDRQMQVDYARIAAKDGPSGVLKKAGTQLDTVLDGNRDDRAKSIRGMEIGRATMGDGAGSSFDKTIGWTKALSAASDLLHSLNKPEDASKHIKTLLQMSKDGNERATDVLEALEIKNQDDADQFIAKLEDPQTKYELIAKVAPKLREFEVQFIDMRAYRHGTGKTPEDILREFPDRKLVVEAREKAEKFAKENYTKADDALAKIIDRKSTEAEREEALDTLRKAHAERTKHIGRSNFAGTVEFAEASNKLKKILEPGDNLTAKEAADGIRELTKLSETGNKQARIYLEALEKHGGAKVLQEKLDAGDAKSLTNVRDALTKSLAEGQDTLRVARITRLLDEKSTSEQWAEAGKKLEEEFKAGNQFAADWQKWTISQEATARIAKADTDPQGAKDAVKALTEAAKDNPYARHALATVLLGTTSNTNLRDWQQVAGNGTLNNKPLFVPNLLPAAAKNAELVRELQKDALAGLNATVGKEHPNGGLTRSESVAVALHMSDAASKTDSENAATADAAKQTFEQAKQFFTKQMNERVPSDKEGFQGALMSGPGSKAAMEGLHAAMALQAPGSSELAELYLKGVDHPNFEIHPFDKNVSVGDLASIRVLSGLASGAGFDQRRKEQAVAALVMAGSDPKLRADVMDELVSAYGKYGDSYNLLSTLGKVAATQEQIPNHVKKAIHDGLESTSAVTRRSAMEGFFAHAPQWDKRDLEAIRKNIKPDMIEALRANADRIPKDIRDQLLVDASAKLDLTKPIAPEAIQTQMQEKLMAIKTMGALSKYATEDQVIKLAQLGEAGGQRLTNPNYKDAVGVAGLKKLGFDDKQALELQTEAARSILRVLGTAEHPKTSAASFDAIGMLKWDGLMNDELRKAVVDYARGDLRDLERLEKVQRLVYDVNIPPPTAQIVRGWKPGYPSEYYFQRAQVIAERFKTDSRTGESVIRDVSERMAMWNALEPSQRREITGSDGPLAPDKALSLEGRKLDPRVYNSLPEEVRQHLSGSKDQVTPDKMPDLKDKSIPAEMFNKLDPAMRRQLTGVDGNLDPAKIEGLMFTGELGKAYPWLLDPNLNKRFEERTREVTAAANALKADQTKLITDKKNTLDALCKQTEDGAGWQRVVSYGMWTSPVGIVAKAFVPDPLDEFARVQSERVKAVSDGDSAISDVSTRLAAIEPVRDALTFADEVRRYESMTNSGFRRSADMQAVTMLEKYGVDVMRVYAPHIFKELTESSGEGQFGRSGMQRLKDNGVTTLDAFQKYDADPRKRFNQGLDALKGIPAGATGADVLMHKQNAIRAIEADPDLNKLTDFAKDVQVHMGTMQRMFQAGTAGTKYDDYVADVRRRAGILKEALEKVTPEQVEAVKARVKELQAAEKDIKDPETKKNIQEKIQSLSELVKMCDSTAPATDPAKGNQRKQLEDMFKHITSRDFDPDTFGKWLKENGPIIAVAVIAAAITVASMGTATPLAIILVTSATMLVATQVAKEVLYQINHYSPGSDTGLGQINDRSYAGAWQAKMRPQWKAFLDGLGDKSLAEGLEASLDMYMKTNDSFFKDVTMPMAKEYFINVAFGLATMGVGNIGAQGLRGAAPKELWKALTTKQAAQLTQGLAEAQALAKSNPSTGKVMMEWLKRVGKEGGNGSLFVGAQEGIHGTAGEFNRTLGKQNHAVSLIIAAGLAFTHAKYSAGRNPMTFKGREVHVDPAFMDPLIKSCAEQGHTINKMPNGTYELRPYNAVAGDAPIVIRTTPPVEVRSPHELPKETAVIPKQELPPTEAAWLTKGAGLMQQGKHAEAYQAAKENPSAPKDLEVQRVELKIDADNVSAGLADHLTAIKKTANVSVKADGKFAMEEPVTIVKLKSGAEVDVHNPNLQKLTPTQKAEFDALMKTPAMQRIMAEHSMTMFEEMFHLRQLQGGGKIISKTYEDYVRASGEQINDPVTGRSRSERSLEQEVVCAMHDAGMPLEAIRQNYGTQYAGRQPVIEYLARGKAGVEPGTAGRSSTTGGIVETGVPYGREPISLRRNTDLTPHQGQLEAFAKSLESRIPNAGERDAIVKTITEHLKTADANSVAALVQKLDALRNSPDFADRARSIKQVLEHPNYSKLQLPLDVVLSGRVPNKVLEGLSTLLDHPTVQQMIERGDIAGLESVRQNVGRSAEQPGFEAYLEKVNNATKKLDPNSKDYTNMLDILGASLKGVPVNVDHVVGMTKDGRNPVAGLINQRGKLEAALATGDAAAFGGASPAQLTKALEIIDAKLRADVKGPAEYAKALTEANGALNKIWKLDPAKRDAALAALEGGTPQVVADPNEWTEANVKRAQDQASKVEGGLKALEALRSAGVPFEMIKGMSADLVAANGPHKLLEARENIAKQIESNTLPEHITKEQAVKIRDSIDNLLRADGAPKEIKDSGKGKDAARECWRAQVEQFNKVLTEIQKPVQTPQERQRSAALADILGSSGKVPFPLPLEKLMNPAFSAENIQRYSEFVKQFEGYRPAGDTHPNQVAWTNDIEITTTLAGGKKNPALDDWAYVPTEPRSRADLIGIDGVFFNLKTGQIRPLDYKADARAKPASETTPLQPFELQTKTEGGFKDLKMAPAEVIQEFLSRPDHCGFDSKPVVDALGALAKDFPGGLPPLRKEPYTSLPEQIKGMEAYLKVLHDRATATVGDARGLSPAFNRLGQGTETALFHMKAKLEIATKLPDLIAQGQLNPLPNGGFELTLATPLRVAPEVQRRFSDALPYDIKTIRIGADGKVTALRDGFGGDVRFSPERPKVEQVKLEAAKAQDATIDTGIGQLNDIYALAKKQATTAAAGRPELEAALPAKLKQMDADLARLQTELTARNQRPTDRPPATGGTSVEPIRLRRTPEAEAALEAKATAAKAKVQASELPPEVKANLDRFVKNDPEVIAITERALKVDQKYVQESGLDTALASKLPTKEVELRLRYAEALKAIDALAASEPKLQSGLNTFMRRKSGPDQLDAQRLALAEDILRLTPKERAEGKIEWYLSKDGREIIPSIKERMEMLQGAVEKAFDSRPPAKPEPIAPKEPVPVKELKEGIDEALSGASADLQLYEWSPAEQTRAGNIAQNALTNHVPGARVTEVKLGESQIAFVLDNGHVLKVARHGTDRWGGGKDEEWGHRVYGPMVRDCPIVPLNGKDYLTYTQDGAQWTAYLQPQASPLNGIKDSNLIFKQVGKQGMGDVGKDFASVQNQFGWLMIGGKKQIVLFDYEAVSK